jgi:hypothetical protein
LCLVEKTKNKIIACFCDLTTNLCQELKKSMRHRVHEKLTIEEIGP